MTNEVPKYTWLKAVFRQCEMSYWKVRNSKAVQGKRQRAMLHGQEVWHDVKDWRYAVTYVFLRGEDGGTRYCTLTTTTIRSS